MSKSRKFISLDDLRAAPPTPSDGKPNVILANQELYSMRMRHTDALEAQPHGNVSRAAMIGVVDKDRISDAISYEWRFQEQTEIYPGMSNEAFDKVVAESSDNKKSFLRMKLWEALRALIADDGPEYSGWIIRCENKNGKASVQLRWREDFKNGWANDSVTMMDATFNKELVEPYFTRPLEVLPADEARMDHVNVLQVMDHSFAASSMIPANDADDQRRENRAREVWRWIWLRANQFRGEGRNGIDVLVICQLGLENILRDWGLPENVDIAHFNAIRGLNHWGRVRCLVSVGRVMPKPADVEAMAEALTGSAVSVRVPAGEWYPKETVGIRLTNGSGWPVENERHPDPVAEAVRYQICECELIQDIGRPRGVNRTAETPLQVDVLTNVCLPLIVDQPIRWKDHAPDKIEEMLCLGMLPKSFAIAARLFPELWSSTDAVRKAAKRRVNTQAMNVLETDIPHIIYSIWGMSDLNMICRPKLTPGIATINRPKRALVFPFLFDPALISDPGAWLFERLGEDTTVVIGPEAETTWQERRR